jgi:hypothetical protein
MDTVHMNPWMLMLASAGAAPQLLKLVFLLEYAAKFIPALIAQLVAWYAQWKRCKEIDMRDVFKPVSRSATVILTRIFQEDGTNSNTNPHGDTDCIDGLLHRIVCLPQAKTVRMLLSGGCVVDHTEAIEIDKDVYFRVRTLNRTVDLLEIINMEVEVYSHTKDLTFLQDFLRDVADDYRIHKENKLGRKLFYLNHCPVKLAPNIEGTLNYDYAPKNAQFFMSPFYTSRSLSNLYGANIHRLRERVSFFINNREWYESKGIPYTMGLLLCGPPGTGKSSIIKAIAKDCHRHVVNVHLDDHVTASQLTNIFRSDLVHVIQDGVTQTYKIPVNQRLLVFEDVDCHALEAIRKRETAIIEPPGATVDGASKVDSDAPSDPGADTTPQQGTDTAAAPQVMSPTTVTRRATPPQAPRAASAYESNYTSYAVNEPSIKPTRHPEKLTLSVILNLMDGVLETPGRIMIMTTNHPEALDPALIRPGRIDIMLQLGNCKASEVQEIVEGIADCKIETEELLPDKTMTPAEVCSRVLKNMDKRLPWAEALTSD